MNIALAQIKSTPGDIAANIEHHLSFIDKATACQCDAIFFPELSLTGYEPTLAMTLGMDTDDSRLEVFQKKSNHSMMTIGVGIPTIKGSDRLISMVVFRPQLNRMVYSKQYLHEDEMPYFIPGIGQQYIDVKGVSIAPAICYESVQWEHFHRANQKPIDLYLASVSKPQRAMAKACNHYEQLSSTYQIHVLMVNSVGPSDNFISSGGSSVWNPRGVKVGSLDSNSESLMVYNCTTSLASIIPTRL